MKIVALDEWRQNGWIKKRVTTREELWNLLQIAKRDLQDAQVTAISPDNRFACGYNGVLKLATVLLYAAGYEPERNQSHHYRVIEAIPVILGEELRPEANYLDLCRKRRNATAYNFSDLSSEQDADKLVQFAAYFLPRVEAWLRQAGWL